MYVRRVAGKQDSSVAVGRGLSSHVGEPGDPGGTVDAVVCPTYGDERLAEIAKGWFGRTANIRFGHHDPDRPDIFVHDHAALDLVLQSAEGIHAERGAMDAERRLLGHLHLGEDVARCRIPPGEFDAGRFAHHAASTVAPDEIFSAQRLTIGQLDVDAGVVLCEASDFSPAIERHWQLIDPAGHYALDVVLPEPEPVRMPSGKVADVQPGAAEPHDLRDLSLGKEPIGDSAHIEDLNGARV